MDATQELSPSANNQTIAPFGWCLYTRLMPFCTTNKDVERQIAINQYVEAKKIFLNRILYKQPRLATKTNPNLEGLEINDTISVLNFLEAHMEHKAGGCWTGPITTLTFVLMAIFEQDVYKTRQAIAHLSNVIEHFINSKSYPLVTSSPVPYSQVITVLDNSVITDFVKNIDHTSSTDFYIIDHACMALANTYKDYGLPVWTCKTINGSKRKFLANAILTIFTHPLPEMLFNRYPRSIRAEIVELLVRIIKYVQSQVASPIGYVTNILRDTISQYANAVRIMKCKVVGAEDKDIAITFTTDEAEPSAEEYLYRIGIRAIIKSIVKNPPPEFDMQNMELLMAIDRQWLFLMVPQTINDIIIKLLPKSIDLPKVPVVEQ